MNVAERSRLPWLLNLRKYLTIGKRFDGYLPHNVKPSEQNEPFKIKNKYIF